MIKSEKSSLELAGELFFFLNNRIENGKIFIYRVGVDFEYETMGDGAAG